MRKLGTVLITLLLLFGGWIASNHHRKWAKEQERRVDAQDIVPTGLRVTRTSSGPDERFDMPGYPAAGVTVFSLQKNVGFIVSELGLDYLNALKATQGKDDGYTPWLPGLVTESELRSKSPEDAELLGMLDDMCKKSKPVHSWDLGKVECRDYESFRSSPIVFYTHGKGRVAMLNPAHRALIVVSAGRQIKRR